FPRRQLQAASECVGVFVDGESRRDRRDLEQHAARLAEIDRREVAAVADLRHLRARRDQPFAQRELLLRAADRHRDVMDRPEPIHRQRRVGAVDDVDRARGTAVADRHPDAVRGFVDPPPAELRRHERDGRRRVAHRQRDAVQTTDRDVRLHRTRRVCRGDPRGARIGDANELEVDAGRIREADRRIAEPRGEIVRRDATRREPHAPRFERADRNGEHRRRHLPGALRADADVLVAIRERRPDRARRADAIAVIKMEHVMVVEIHRLLHEPQPEHAQGEVEVVLRAVDRRRHVMKTEDAHRDAGVYNSQMTRHLPLALALAASLSAAPLLAADGILIVQKTTTAGGTQTHEVQIEQNRMRAETAGMGARGGMDAGPQAIIFDGAKQTLWIVNEARKTYSEMTKADVDRLGGQMSAMMAQMQEQMKNMPPEQRARMEAMMRGRGAPGAGAAPKTTYKKIGSDTVGKWKCDKYEGYQGDKKVSELCTVEPSVLGFTAADFQVTKELAQFFGSMMPKVRIASLRSARPSSRVTADSRCA